MVSFLYAGIVAFVGLAAVALMFRAGTRGSYRLNRAQVRLDNILSEEKRLLDSMKVGRTSTLDPKNPTVVAKHFWTKLASLDKACLLQEKRLAHRKLLIAKHVIEILQDAVDVSYAPGKLSKLNTVLGTLGSLCQDENLKRIFQDFQVELDFLHNKVWMSVKHKQTLALTQDQRLLILKLIKLYARQSSLLDRMKSFATDMQGALDAAKEFYAEATTELAVWNRLFLDEKAKKGIMKRM